MRGSTRLDSSPLSAMVISSVDVRPNFFVVGGVFCGGVYVPCNLCKLYL